MSNWLISVLFQLLVIEQNSKKKRKKKIALPQLPEVSGQLSKSQDTEMHSSTSVSVSRSSNGRYRSSSNVLNPNKISSSEQSYEDYGICSTALSANKLNYFPSTTDYICEQQSLGYSFCDDEPTHDTTLEEGILADINDD